MMARLVPRSLEPGDLINLVFGCITSALALLAVLLLLRLGTYKVDEDLNCNVSPVIDSILRERALKRHRRAAIAWLRAELSGREHDAVMRRVR